MATEKHDFITIEGTSLKYTMWAGGEKVLLCFHGFSQNHSHYGPMYQALKEAYTVYSFDLFFHGQTVWRRGEQSFRPRDWYDFIKIFLEKETIEEFAVMGFSMGGRFAMITAQQFPGRVRHTYLLAPDGIKIHFFYKLFTYPYLLRKLFKAQIKDPRLFYLFTRLVLLFKMIEPSTLYSARNQMDSELKRIRTYYSWTIFRHLVPDLRQVAETANNKLTRLTLYIGKHDKVIGRKEIKPLIDLLDHYELHELDCGHEKLIGAVAKTLRKAV